MCLLAYIYLQQEKEEASILQNQALWHAAYRLWTWASRMKLAIYSVMAPLATQGYKGGD
jgi:hypothetical protein